MRPFTMDDLQEAHTVLDSHPEVWRYDPGYPPTLERRESLLEFRILEYTMQGFGCLALILKETQRIIGYCGLQLYLWENPACSTPEVELFYKLGREYWGKGYATEAARAIVDFSFNTLKLKRLVSHAKGDNARSVALMQRIGMRIENDPLHPGEINGILSNYQCEQG